MLRLVQSNKMEVLAAQLVEQLKQPAGGSLFEPTQILVQSPGMAQWLKMQIAETTGIAANLQFPLPSSFIWSLYQRTISDLPEQSAFSKSHLTWKLMHILPAMLEQDDFAALRDYLADQQVFKRYQLCHKIADVFDQYLMYRPDWIQHWQAGHDDLPEGRVEGHAWQAQLWRALESETARLGESPWHRANLHDTLLTTLTNAAHQHSASAIHVFGISAMPKQQLEVLQAVASQRDVFIYWCNPSWHYWGDVVDNKTRARLARTQDEQTLEYYDVGNPLLASWGKLGRDYQDMLLSLDLEQHDGFVDVAADSLLTHVQGEVFNLTQRGAESPLPPHELLGNGEHYTKHRIADADRSFQVHVCHSRVRELEVLHQQLLHAFEQDPTLTPGDVIVMMPDVAAYAPFIDAIFTSQGAGSSVPFAISDLSVRDDSAIVASFLQLMNLHHSRMHLREFKALMDVPAIQRRFELTSQDILLLTQWLEEAGVRWGWDGQDKRRWDVPADDQFTWLFGLQRLLAGYAMHPDVLYQTGQHSIAPFADVEGQQALALGKLYVCIEQLIQLADACQSEVPLADKLVIAGQVLDDFYCFDDTEMLYANQLRQTLESMQVHTTQYAQPVSQDIFVAELEQRLTERGVGQRFLAGYVNFCTLMPMRSVPFRWVCILGLNDQDYPRQTTPMGFDLMQHTPSRRGDRSRRLDDRYLFLEAILSARQTLYISYQGFSVRDNSVRTPSVLLDELLEYCEQTFMLADDPGQCAQASMGLLREHLITEHPLQPFDARYFRAQSRLARSFIGHWLAVLNAPREKPDFLHEPLPALEAQDTDWLIDDVIQALQNPARAFYRLRWQTSLRESQQPLEDDEAFTLDGLARFKLLEALVEQPEDATLQQRLQAEAQLPLGNMADIGLDTVRQQAQGLRERLLQARAKYQPTRLEIACELSCGTISGWCDHMYGSTLVRWRAGKLRAKDRLSLWLTWLALNASPQQQRLDSALLVASDATFRLPAIDPQTAHQYLDALLVLVSEVSQQPLLFFPDASWMWVTKQDQRKALDAFYGNDFAPGEASEPHIHRICPSLEAVFDTFAATSEQIFAPLHALASEEKG